MRLWLISQSENTGCDTFDSAVVAASTREAAATIHPYELRLADYREVWSPRQMFQLKPWEDAADTWASSPDKVEVKYLGRARPGTKEGVILASFNAG